MATVMRFTRLAALAVPFLASWSSARAQTELFDPVWTTMSQQFGPGSPGCGGCHIAPQPTFGPWFGGDTEEAVLRYFLEGPGMQLVAGCRESILAEALGLIEGHPPVMPLFAPDQGRFWMDCPDAGLTELTDLGNWLDSICF